VRVEGVRILTVPALFRLPGLRRYGGYALSRTILLKRPLDETFDDLLTHELCHVWQMQNRPWDCLWRWLTTRYCDNPYEQEAREAVRLTRDS
jgi:hypothetical protein